MRREFEGLRLEWWLDQAPGEQLDLLIGAGLTHPRYRTPWRIESVVNRHVVARSEDGGPTPKRIALDELVQQAWVLVVPQGNEPLVEAIECSKPKPPLPSLEEAVAEFLQKHGADPDRFLDHDDRVFVVDCWLQWHDGERVGDDEQFRFYNAIKHARAFELGIPPLRGWLEKSEQWRKEPDHPRRLRLSVACRSAGRQPEAKKLTEYAEDPSFSIKHNTMLALQVLTHRAAVLLDIQDLTEPPDTPDALQVRRQLVTASRELLARAAALRPDGVLPSKLLGHEVGSFDPFDALQSRARFAAASLGLLSATGG